MLTNLHNGWDAYIVWHFVGPIICCPCTCKNGATAFTAIPLHTIASKTIGDKPNEFKFSCIVENDENERDDDVIDEADDKSILPPDESIPPDDIVVETNNNIHDNKACVAILIVINDFVLLALALALWCCVVVVDNFLPYSYKRISYAE